LATPSLIALRRFLPNAEIDILLEDWVAPVLEGFDAVDNVIAVGDGLAERGKLALKLRKRNYDVAYNLHGGTTGTFFTFASSARHRVGFQEYQYSFLYNDLFSSSLDFWKADKLHSAEQQLALLGFTGVPVEDRPKSKLYVTDAARQSIERKLTAEARRRRDGSEPGAIATGFSPLPPDPFPLAMLHPAAAFATKEWSAENFARVAEYLDSKGLKVVAVAAKKERAVLEKLKAASKAEIITFDDLTLPEITALASRAKIFVGNDSGIAHIAAAVDTPSVVVFGSSNRAHWRPWTDAPNEIVYEEFACQPCAGYECKEFGEPKCILSVSPETVISAVERVLSINRKKL
jgi:lipopolysaccharide heptosyltransferase II